MALCYCRCHWSPPCLAKASVSHPPSPSLEGVSVTGERLLLHLPVKPPLAVPSCLASPHHFMIYSLDLFSSRWALIPHVMSSSFCGFPISSVASQALSETGPHMLGAGRGWRKRQPPQVGRSYWARELTCEVTARQIDLCICLLNLKCLYRGFYWVQ